MATTAARAAGAIIAGRFGGSFERSSKGRFDPVTEVDRAAELAIVTLLTEHRPDDGILAEEGSGHAATGRRWIVDPLDGTVNFVHAIPQVSVSIALYDGDRGLIGVVFDPLRDEMFVAVSGSGATLNGAPIRVSNSPALEDSVVATGFPYDHGTYPMEYATTLAAVLARANGIRRMGSAALDLCWVAAGRFDGYFELVLAPWDIAAGLVILTEAGGRSSDAFGEAMVPESSTLVCSNGAVQEELFECVHGSLPAHIVSHRAYGGLDA